MNRLNHHRTAQFLFVVYSIISLFSVFYFDGTGDAGDSVLHFLYAKEVPLHPENLLKHWAKPIYTLLASPFAQLGFTGVKLMNVCFSLASIWLTYKSCKRLNLKNAWVVMLIMMCSPLFFVLSLSGLTEPLFALIVIYCFSLILKNKYGAAALILSFLPFVRSEGLIIIGLFALYFLHQKKWKVLPYLLMGHIVYSIVGYAHYEDILWVFSKIPYSSLSSVYGNGDLFHFVDQMVFVLGVPNYILLILGLIGVLFSLRTSNQNAELFLILAVAVVFFSTHSLFWYYGVFNSLGLKRVFVGIIPFLAIIALFGYNLMTEKLPKLWPSKKNISSFIALPLLALVLIFPFTKSPAAIFVERDLKLSKEQQLSHEVVEYLKKSQKTKQRLVAVPSYFSLLLNIDHFDGKQHLKLASDKLAYLQTGDIIIWDDWYAQRENLVDLEKLRATPGLEELKTFETRQDGRLIQYVVFEKTLD